MIALLLTLFTIAAPLDADHAVGVAVERSVDVARAEADVQRAEARARASQGLRQDPFVQLRWAAVGDLHGISVRQSVSLTGEGWAARRSAVAALAGSRASHTHVRMEVAAATRMAWVEAVEARGRVILAERDAELAARLRRGAEARLRTGEGSLLDARLARLQLTEAQAALMQAITDASERLAELSSWTGLDVADLELPDDPLDALAEIELSASTRSDLEATRRGVDSALAGLTQARAATLPPVQLGAFYEQEGEALRVGPSVGITIPLWSRNAEGRAVARADLALAEAAVAARTRQVRAEQQATAQALERLDAIDLDVDAPAEARAALDSIATGYERGELDLLTTSLLRQQVVDGQRAWLATRRVRARARITAALAHAHPALLGQP